MSQVLVLYIVQPLTAHTTGFRSARFVGSIGLATLGFGSGEFGLAWAMIGLFVSKSWRRDARRRRDHRSGCAPRRRKELKTSR